MNHKPTASSYAYAKWADPPKDTPHRANNKRNRSELGHSTEQNSQGPQAKTGTIFRILNGAIVVNGSIEEKQYEASQKEPTKATQGDNPGTAESNQDTKICWDVEEVLQDFIEEDARLGNIKFLPHEIRNILKRARKAMAEAGEASQKEFTTAFQKRAMGTELLQNLSFHATQIQAEIAISAEEMRDSTQKVLDNALP